jgi:hypothetical protein
MFSSRTWPIASWFGDNYFFGLELQKKYVGHNGVTLNNGLYKEG